MKVLLLSSPNVKGRGGQVRSHQVLRNIGNKYLQASDMHLITINTPQRIVNELSTLGYNIYNLSLDTKHLELAIVKLSLNVLDRIKVWRNFDMIVSHSEHPLYVIPTFIASRVAHVPWTVIVNSHMYINPLYRYSYNGLLPLTRLARSILTINAMNMTLVHLVSSVIQEKLAKVGFYLKYYDVLDVPAGVDKGSIAKALKEVYDKVYDAAFMGVFTKEKGIYDLLLVAYKFKKIAGRSMRILMLGRFESKYEERLFMSIAGKLEVLDSFIFKGYLTGLNKYRELARAKVFLFPSHVDVFPISVIEALALGLPVVTWNLPYAKQFSTSAVIKVDSITDYVSTTIALLNDENRSFLSEEAKRYASKFTWDNAARCEYNAYVKTIQWWAENA